ncbi:hypothetical protein [Nocardioides convexus]|uniref:hypothetical protein n=1 Tax=Nocardioides convexus TaxID=2712224 RepID=UPI0024184273|nr:hypothetical protein [Nocardioides convexus]
MTPPAFLARCADRAAVEDVVVVGVRPVTDTVKEVTGEPARPHRRPRCPGRRLLPGRAAAVGGRRPRRPAVDGLRRAGHRPAGAVRRGPGRARRGAPEARRVASGADIAVLEALTDPR